MFLTVELRMTIMTIMRITADVLAFLLWSCLHKHARWACTLNKLLIY